MSRQLYSGLIEKAAEWAPEAIRTLRRREKYSPARETNPASSTVQAIASSKSGELLTQRTSINFVTSVRLQIRQFANMIDFDLTLQNKLQHTLGNHSGFGYV
jgi:hypothetical protein